MTDQAKPQTKKGILDHHGKVERHATLLVVLSLVGNGVALLPTSTESDPQRLVGLTDFFEFSEEEKQVAIVKAFHQSGSSFEWNEGLSGFVHKPYAPAELLKAIRDGLA